MRDRIQDNWEVGLRLSDISSGTVVVAKCGRCNRRRQLDRRRLIQRFGKERIVATGLLLLAASAAVSLSGLAVWQFWTGLVLLGLGWNFGFIGSTAIVAETYRPSEKNKTQGLHDFVLFSSVSLASFLSGRTFVAAGWETMNMVVFPVVLVCLVVLVLQARFAPLQPAAD